MKGLLFTEFLAFVGDRWGADTVDRLARLEQWPVGGAYDPLRAYDPAQLLRLVAATGAYTGAADSAVLSAFGEHLFARFAALYPVFFVGIDSASAFLAGLETHVHGEVRKLHPDAALPTLQVRTSPAGEIDILYAAPRPLADLAEGLIRGCVARFAEPLVIDRYDDPAAPGRTARFTLRPLRA
jgi:Haem-NO-binding